MKIGQIIAYNQKLGYQIKDVGSLEFAINYKTNNTILRLAYIIRAIVVDHTFTDGNKRTAYYATKYIARQKAIIIDDEALIKNIFIISKKNITNINNIRKRIYNAIKRSKQNI